MQFAGEVAIVTGAGRGQGEATAKLFAAEGAHVVVVDIDEDLAQGAAKGIVAEGGRATAAGVDVADAAQVQHLVEETVRLHSKIDVLINNAGITLFKSIYDTTEEEWDRIIDVDLKSIFLTCKAVLPVIRDNGKGSIVNISSTSGLRALPNHTAYCAAKAGVVNLTKALALDVAGQGIRVNCICPGPVDTAMFRSAMEDDPVKTERVRAATPLGRFGDPSEIGTVSLFLCSPAASYVSGVVIPVDGGRGAGS